MDPVDPLAAHILDEAERAARLSRIRVQAFEVRNPDDLGSVFAAMTRGRVGAVLVSPSLAFFIQRSRIAALASKHRLPAIFPFRAWVEAGGLMSYGPDYPDLMRRAATYVDRILKGAKLADLPVEQPTKFELILNMRTAKTIGLTIPRSLLLLAAQVIE